MFRYVHTNIIAKDAQKLIKFYKGVLKCRSIGETRDLRGEWLDRLTGISNAHIVGEHLCLPGYDKDHPTLEIFSYDTVENSCKTINKSGMAHLAFEVDDVESTLQLVLQNGGNQIGELVKTEFADGRKAVFAYATDCEGNIIELQSWS
ncbi:VOC family protein [Lachnospiraceae bacterium MD1]|uniref:VOC family protein n=1 Tax=Variimorphobacter saccharofermentans TaxID=2755051 RepID=A0A839K4K3_9FIRM|nr:VOC family protein [Variimorphobacter saccharofermentans]MBB2183979.1 VOC family protein [Variimorphobacter saccharofermentans]